MVKTGQQTSEIQLQHFKGNPWEFTLFPWDLNMLFNIFKTSPFKLSSSFTLPVNLTSCIAPSVSLLTFSEFTMKKILKSEWNKLEIITRRVGIILVVFTGTSPYCSFVLRNLYSTMQQVCPRSNNSFPSGQLCSYSLKQE